jgi:hypothetical protein
MKRTTLINPGKAAGLSIRSPRMGILVEVQKMKIANTTTKQATRKSLSCFDIFYSPLIKKSPLAPLYERGEGLLMNPSLMEI